MPPTTRRTSANARASSSGRQATISFNHRVTKPTGPNATKAKSGKDLVSSSSIITSQPTKQSPLAKNATTSAQPEDAADEDEESLIKDAEELNEEAQLEEPEAEKEAVEKSEAAQRADTITDRQIGMYWRLLERRRTAARIHQEDLTLAEKVLRYWDVSSQYGVRLLSIFCPSPLLSAPFANYIRVL